MKETEIHIFLDGGPLMWPLILLSILTLFIFIERTLYLHKGNINCHNFITGIKNLLRKRRLVEALTVCEETKSPMAQIVKTALLNHSQDENKMRLAIQNTAILELPFLERRIGTLEMISKISPLIGLLGTIIALLQTFFQMKTLGGTYFNSSQLAGYLGQALITTATGLSISIVAKLCLHFLQGRIKSMINNMEWIANTTIEFIYFDLPEEETQEKS